MVGGGGRVVLFRVRLRLFRAELTKNSMLCLHYQRLSPGLTRRRRHAVGTAAAPPPAPAGAPRRQAAWPLPPPPARWAPLRRTSAAASATAAAAREAARRSRARHNLTTAGVGRLARHGGGRARPRGCLQRRRHGSGQRLRCARHAAARPSPTARVHHSRRGKLHTLPRANFQARLQHRRRGIRRQRRLQRHQRAQHDQRRERRRERASTQRPGGRQPHRRLAQALPLYRRPQRHCLPLEALQAGRRRQR